jgi:hypothetical protein
MALIEGIFFREGTLAAGRHPPPWGLAVKKMVTIWLPKMRIVTKKYDKI